MKNLDERADVYARGPAGELLTRLAELGINLGTPTVNAAAATLVAVIDSHARAFKDGAMVAEHEQPAPPTRVSIRIDAANVDEVARLILAESVMEDGPHALGFNMGLRKAVSLLARRGHAKVPMLVPEESL